ncbi:MAG: phosphoribosyltransferase [Patescibacteria group bacterium]|nr:phosphoribosyltransferase [Patescibacteria group bacterium]
MIPQPYFSDRYDAGRQLAARLEQYKSQSPLVLALPRGGVAVGLEVARGLSASLDVFVALKLGYPGNPEYGIGAIAEGGIIVLNQSAISDLKVSKAQLQGLIDNETAEMERRIALFRGNRHNPQVRNKTVILVDDGLATGVTAQAALESLKLGKPKKLILAVPVCAADTAAKFRSGANELVCLHEIEDFLAVGLWYGRFPQLSDRDVLNLLQTAHRGISVGP